MGEIPVTQRAYTLRLKGTSKHDHEWRQCLWRTHEAVNRAAHVFGDWLLTLRGGISHIFAEVQNELQRKDRCVILALSWLSVESERGAPLQYLVPVDSDGKQQTVETLRSILRSRDVAESEIEDWVAVCVPSLQATIRDDAVWINRSAAFDVAVSACQNELSRDDVWDLLSRFFGSPEAYFETISEQEATDDQDDGEAKSSDDGEKDLAQKARGWLSNRFGSGTGADFADMGRQYLAFEAWCRWMIASPQSTAGEQRQRLAEELKIEELPQRLAGTPGPSNWVQTTFRQIVEALKSGGTSPSVDYAKIADEAKRQADEKSKLVGRKRAAPWSLRILEQAVAACGFSFRDTQADSDRINEFSVILDHAARRLCVAHSWIILAEKNRRSFEKDAALLNDPSVVSTEARAWLDNFCAARTTETNAVEPYRIRKRAVEGWKELVAKWSRKDCQTVEDRIRAARALQDDPDVEKFGDIQLYEALAADDAICIRQQDGNPAPDQLVAYALATDAVAKQRRFKVPAYRHPDPLRHPVFCDFGESRWGIDFAIHRAGAQAESTQDQAKKKSDALDKARQAVSKSKTPERTEKAQAKVAKLELDLQSIQRQAHWLSHRHALRMTLFDGTTVADRELVWQSKRFTNDAALPRNGHSPQNAVAVTRADRLGRAAVTASKESSVVIRDLFNLKYWNGRLQAPRAQLDEIAAVLDDARLSAAERQYRINRMISRLRWLVSFSARLQPQGPWVDLVENLPAGWKYDWKKRRLFNEDNKRRKGRAQLVLSRLPGLRILSVDLGHRYAAACAVWQTLSADEMTKLCVCARVAPPKSENVFLCLETDGKRGIYRRIGPDSLPEGPHPGPWAKLERQFLIKLQGEQDAPRKSSAEELRTVDRFESSVGCRRTSARKGLALRVDELMFETVRTARLAISRHGRRAKIAYRLTADKIPITGGQMLALDVPGRTNLLIHTLIDWHELASDTRWVDALAQELWERYIVPHLNGRELPKSSQDESSQARKKRQEELEELLRPVAEKLVIQHPMILHVAWATRWREDDEMLRRALRWLRDWIIPRGRQAASGSIRNVGGLSLTRIATMKALYQVQKAYRMRAEPDDLRKNIPSKGDDALRDFGKSILVAMEHLRENRVKQVASRIVEAALGIGTESPNGVQRPRQRIHVACHAVIVENLSRYRPEETRTRRENRQLMSWASAKIQKYLAESCQLYGLHLWEASAAYTSRQDSRTGAPGIRCRDLPVAEFINPLGWVKKLIEKAEGSFKRYLDDMAKRWDSETKTWHERFVKTDGAVVEREWGLVDGKWYCKGGAAIKPGSNPPPRPIRIIARGGEIFVSGNITSSASGGLQADVNAAANIGLKALLDPDWEGSWWYVPCDATTFCPLLKATSGSAVVSASDPLKKIESETGDTGKKKRGKAKGESDRPVNLWRDVSSSQMTEGVWREYAEYQNLVQWRVIQVLRSQAGLQTETA